MNKNTRKIRIAFVKYNGLSAGGTERWMQQMAASLPKDKFEVDYYYSKPAKLIGSDLRHSQLDEGRKKYLIQNKVKLTEFHVKEIDVRFFLNKWTNTNFWQIFDESKYDIIQVATAGPTCYPNYIFKKPIVEFISLNAGVDFCSNIFHSIHLSPWQLAQWHFSGGNKELASVIPIPVERPQTNENLRFELEIPKDAIVCGFHQRAENSIASEIPLQAFSSILKTKPQLKQKIYFIIMGGGAKYKDQAKQLGLENVRFVKHDSNNAQISKFLNTLDIYAHGRKDGETFGTVLAEAMIHKKPCLSHYSKTGANAQPYTMNEGGIFATNLNDYTQKLSKLMSDEGLRHELANKGHKYALENYTLKYAIENLQIIYNHIMLSAHKKPKKIPELNYNTLEKTIFIEKNKLRIPNKIKHILRFCFHRLFIPILVKFTSRK